MTKASVKQRFICNECGAESAKWTGQCMNCGAWNSLTEVVIQDSRQVSRFASPASKSAVQRLDQIENADFSRLSSGSSELDRVLGGGLVPGSVVLIGGDPGIGKSTLLLQYLSAIGQGQAVFYASGEESAEQIASRAKRLQVDGSNLLLLAENRLEELLDALIKEQPSVVVVDSIQTFFSDAISSAPGSVSQVRECAARLVRYAKQTGATVILVGHVTKEGSLAGPRILEHMVDSVLYFEGEGGSIFRLIRAVKNRFGMVNEIGVFAMSEKGLRDVHNPSAMFVSRYGADSPGTVVLATQEGTRPLLVEVQALVDDSGLANPRRLCVGLEQNRLAMLLAIIHRHTGISLNNQDVFANVAGGVRVGETGSDLALMMAILSSIKNQATGSNLVVFGEVGLAGELRPVQRGADRLREARKLGFERALIPAANMPEGHAAEGLHELEIIPARRIEDALTLFDV